MAESVLTRAQLPRAGDLVAPGKTSGVVAHFPLRLHGTIRRRLLVNAFVDPVEAAGRLPDGVRPHVTDQGTVVGCCMLDIADIRPMGMPAAVGLELKAAAHRISVEWDDPDAAQPVTGVFVPVRHSPSRAARMMGGRLFPGVHERAVIASDLDGEDLRWTVKAANGDGAFDMTVTARVPNIDATDPSEIAGMTCIGATLGLSPDRRGRLETARMTPDVGRARPVEITELRSSFVSGFGSAQAATSYLMTDVDVAWRPEPSKSP